ncbi:NFACT family protein [Ruminococcaceae bacterium OttesenSCG-928-A16]|nr:NFACT family protein [Ruminococcaceae bacterium OttesenSCG-928-A16]
MALDAATLALCAAELTEILLDARVDKVFQPTRDEVILQLRTRAETFRLLLSARSGSARACLTQTSYENPAIPPSFCMLLRKHLTGGRLFAVRTIPAERIVFFDFTCTNEMGDLVQNTMAAELMGRYCNLVLVQNDKIIDALKRVDFEASEVRQLLPGLAYTLPPQPKQLHFLTAPASQITAAIAQMDVPVAEALRKTTGGVGPVVLREACYRALGGQDKAASALLPAELAALQTAIEQIRDDFEKGGQPNLVRRADGMPAEFSFTRLTQYLPQFTLEEYPGFSAMLEGYYAEKDRVERLRQKSKQLRKTLQNMHERALRKQAARTEELAESEQSDGLRIFGELLTANLHTFAKGDKIVRVQNWYNGEMVDIALDVRLGPSANAQKYFKEYKKKQTAIKMLRQLLEAGEKEIEYFGTVLYEVDTAEGEAALNEIRAELKAQGYLKHYKPRDKKQKPADFLRYHSSDGFLILVGRNNLQNDKLTLKTARGKDLWFHTKNAPGSHVVVLSEGQDIPLATQNEAAMLAVVHSSQKNSAKVPVDYTEVRNIRKTGDLPPGMVLYEHYETAYVTPEEEVLKRVEQVL